MYSFKLILPAINFFIINIRVAYQAIKNNFKYTFSNVASRHSLTMVRLCEMKNHKYLYE